MKTKKQLQNEDALGVYYAEKERKRDLYFDKRVTKIVFCDMCGAPISQNKYNKNGGYCDTCIDIFY